MPTNTPDILRNGDPVAVDTVGAYTSNYWRQRAAKVTRHPIGFTNREDTQ